MGLARNIGGLPAPATSGSLSADALPHEQADDGAGGGDDHLADDVIGGEPEQLGDEAADEAAVVGLGVELDAGLDAVMRVSVKCAHELYHRMCAMGIARRTYTSTGVRPPWVSEQQTAPAKAKRE